MKSIATHLPYDVLKLNLSTCIIPLFSNVIFLISIFLFFIQHICELFCFFMRRLKMPAYYAPFFKSLLVIFKMCLNKTSLCEITPFQNYLQ